MLVIRFSAVALFLFAFGFSTGCSKKSADPVRASISGKVTISNSPLTGGNLIFQRDGKEVANLKIETDGTYTGVVPMGDLLVGVDTEKIKLEETNQGSNPGGFKFDPKDMEKMMKYKDKKLTPEDIAKLEQDRPKVKYVPIPEKYRDPGKSGFTVSIQAGKNEKDFPIP